MTIGEWFGRGAARAAQKKRKKYLGRLHISPRPTALRQGSQPSGINVNFVPREQSGELDRLIDASRAGVRGGAPTRGSCERRRRRFVCAEAYGSRCSSPAHVAAVGSKVRARCASNADMNMPGCGWEG